MKLCPKCNLLKNKSDFYLFKNKIKTPCKSCKIAYQSFYFIKNKEIISKYKNHYYSLNRLKLIYAQRIANLKRANDIKSYQFLYRRNNKFLQIKRREYRKRMPLNLRLRRRISNAIFQSLKYKSSSILQHLPYLIQQLKEHIESQFEPWMNWNNWGIYDPKTWDSNPKWQIDHIIPHSRFKYTSMKDKGFTDCWALSNLRPYSAKQNIMDGNRK